jgi:DNA-binding transcriptional ArsR family regulator
MNVSLPDSAVSNIAAAIGDPARSRMLYCLIDGRARTSTELAAIAEVAPSTASAHLHRLMLERLVNVFAQGKHRYYSLEGADVASALEALSVLAGQSRKNFEPSTPYGLRFARTCYDHIAGMLGVCLHDKFLSLGWLAASADDKCTLTAAGEKAFATMGVEVENARALRRRFAYDCVDWSERRPHLAGALGAAFLKLTLKKKWLLQDADGRALSITRVGRREIERRFQLSI